MILDEVLTQVTIMSHTIRKKLEILEKHNISIFRVNEQAKQEADGKQRI